jgi:hypothetical protein
MQYAIEKKMWTRRLPHTILEVILPLRQMALVPQAILVSKDLIAS